MNFLPKKDQLRPSAGDTSENLTVAQVAFAKVVGQALAEHWHRLSRVRSTKAGHSARQYSGSNPRKP